MKIFKTWTFKWWEISFIKICLLSLGIILGIYFYNSLARSIWLWWILFFITALYFIKKMIKENKKAKTQNPPNNPQ